MRMKAPAHPAILNVRTEGKRQRLAIPVLVKLLGYGTVSVVLPWGATTQAVAPDDLLAPNGIGFSLPALRDAHRKYEEEINKAKKLKKKARKS